MDSVRRDVCPVHNQGAASPTTLFAAEVKHNPTLLLSSLVQDTVAVKPHQFGIPADQALIHEINTIYANKVLHDVGLCVAVFDLVEVGEGKVRYGDGCLWYKRASLCS